LIYLFILSLLLQGAVLTRSAQPMVGLTQKNCQEDAVLLNLFRTKGAEHK
jgi:hypothetical protein